VLSVDHHSHDGDVQPHAERVGAGDAILVTAPSYRGTPQAFNGYEPRYDHMVAYCRWGSRC